jgi:hypothetical protein
MYLGTGSLRSDGFSFQSEKWPDKDEEKKGLYPTSDKSWETSISHGGGDSNTTTSVAFIGNSMFYFNDFPRFFEEISEGTVVQNSCLHGGASIGSLLLEGNSMYPQFETSKAILGKDHQGNTIYDYGACTVAQLLLGRDNRLGDPGYPLPGTDLNNTNPCTEDATYMKYAMEEFHDSSITKTGWDFVLINDNTRNPAKGSTRQHALQNLEHSYVPWLLETGSTPVFLWTHAYTPDYTCETDYVESTYDRNMTGLKDIANFTSLTGAGYQAYVDLLSLHLPAKQAPRIAPVGLAFLVVHEENYELWKTLFHCDNLHASPSGTFLQGCIIYYALFGKMPIEDLVLREDMASLWKSARMMQHAWEPPNPFPDLQTAKYLYSVAERVMKEGYVPKSFINYQNGEVAYELAR